MGEASEDSGFFWLGSDKLYHVLVMPKRRKAKPFELSADSPQKLVRAAREAKWNIGTVAHVKELCETAPCSRNVR